jgi:sugar/nucleoside kinase (ribokinase family)
MTARLVSVGNVVVDVLATVPELPVRGGDVLATGSAMLPGGSFNTMLAAQRQGLATAYAGGHGTGFFGDLVRAALTGAGIEILAPASRAGDSGYDIALVDAGGERTFVTVFGVEANLSASALAEVVVRDGDLVHVSGYGLLASTNATVLEPWIRALAPSHTVLLDPGPLVADIRPAVLRVVRDRADWLSCNEREAIILTGAPDARSAIDILGASSRGVLVRLGADGCLLCHDRDVVHVPGFPVTAVDTNGAGDAHCGAFLAALADGRSPFEAATRANACAAIATTRRGPATAPTLAEVLAILGA